MKKLNALILSALCATTFFISTIGFEEKLRLNLIERQSVQKFANLARNISIGYALFSISYFIGIAMNRERLYNMDIKTSCNFNLTDALLPLLVTWGYCIYNNMQIETLEQELNRIASS